MDHQVDQRAVAEPVAEARLLQHVGAFDIDSMPPATTTLWSPERIIGSAISTARMREAHTLLIVSAGTSIGRPGADRGLPRGRLAGAALEHLAHDHVLDLVVARRRRGRARARIAIAPSSVACLSASPPPSLPKGVRTAETITERAMVPIYPHGLG